MGFSDSIGTSVASVWVMNFFDLLIIYLTCGAPTAVYYFLQNRRAHNQPLLATKTFFVLVFWIPFLLAFFVRQRLGRHHANKDLVGELFSDSNLEKKVRAAKIDLEKMLFENNSNSIYETRKTVDQYLTFALLRRNDNLHYRYAQSESEIFRIAGHKNLELAGICLQRRNEKKLNFHHTLARLEFLDLISGSASVAAPAIEFVSLLGDYETQAAIEKMFDLKIQGESTGDVISPERQLWNSKHRKRGFTNTLSTRMKSMTASVNSRKND